MGNFKEVSTEKLKKWMDEKEDFVLLDVLALASYEARHISMAKSAPVGDPDFLDKIAELVPEKDTLVVVYCSNAQCGASPRAAAALVDAGYTDVYHYNDGLAGWQNAKYSFEGEAAQQ